MVGKEHPHSRENRILNIRVVRTPPEHSNQRRMNMIAKTILEQIGGRRFAAMTGSKDFIDMGNGLRMSLARNKTHEGIYCDMLEEMFTMVTGLYTRF